MDRLKRLNRIAGALVLVGGLCLDAAGATAQVAPKAAGIESEGYEWNKMEGGEKEKALTLEGDVENGEEAYEICSGCHLPSGAGRPDGTFPQLAGQHTTVIIKQIADIRAGRRDNPIMYPFAMSLSDQQELADVAAYIQTLPIPTDNGKGPGGDLELGKKLFDRDCVKCHGEHGEGNAEKFYPVLAGQHYKYLLRQITAIAQKKRRNANPDMVKVVEKYTPEQLAAVVDYMSRLTWPERSGK
ncbi:MAG TPA: c-type cytochrome [Deltaproteobacteria bacterium]|nr:c-type cytochrome [Deltaproteobacteria bacterium]